ncbi:MAG: methyl-accepting chemotaxis protein WspA [Chlamydiales bacterium]|jgi:methyl-accepting chemotaxis protein WspA
MLLRVSIKTRLIFLLAVMTFLLVGIAGIGLRNLKESNEALKTVYEDRALSLLYLTKMSDAYVFKIIDPINKLNDGRLEYGDVLERFDEGETIIHEQWSAYLKTKLVAEEQLLIDELAPFIEDVNQYLVFIKEKIGGEDKAVLMDYLKVNVEPMVSIIHPKLSELNELQIQVTQLEYENAQKIFAQQKIDVAIAIVVGLILALAIAYPIIKTITGSLNRVTAELRELGKGEADLDKRIPVTSNDEVGELSQSFNDLMDRLASLVRKVLHSDKQVNVLSQTIGNTWEHLESSVERSGALTIEIVDIAKEISQTSHRLVSTMDRLSEIANKTTSLASDGQKSLERLEDTMAQVEKASRQIHHKLTAINDKAANITVVVTTITKVADQTNLLSLNAAIEAEKAGEYGVGFSVVAREIRRLADQTAVATLDIEQIVRDMKVAVDSGVDEMKTFSHGVKTDVMEVRNIGAQLTKITEHVQELTPKFQGVHEGVQVQAQGADKISEAMTELGAAASDTSNSLRRSLEDMKILYQAVEDLHTQVSLFKVEEETT